MSIDILSKKLHKWKTSLIDLSKRNRLLNFKDTVSTVIQFQPKVDEIYKQLDNDKAIRVNTIADLVRFVEKEKRALKKKLGIEDNGYEMDLVEQAAYEKLENALQAIRLKAKSSLDEKGINTLFITFGSLTWKESKDSNIELKSPLLLLPVTLTRESSSKPYYLQKYDDDLTLNPTLVQKLRIDFGIELPGLPEEEVNVSEYLKTLQLSVGKLPGSSVTIDSYLGLFSFSKLVMYKDFEQYFDKITQHDLIQQLAGVAQPKEFDSSGESDSIRAYDHSQKSVESFQILDADSSQQEAILAANRGKSFIISGPPGTGKSQTISNIIAESLAKGKKVLFVSEKKAALEVVKKRLDSQNLGDFCLELHSNNANKKYVLQELHRTLNMQYSPKSTALPFDAFDKIKVLLNNYVNALHTPIGALGVTAHRVHGELSKLDQVHELTFSINEIAAVNSSKLDTIYDLLDRMRQYIHLLQEGESHIWHGAQVEKFTFELQSDISAKFKKHAGNLKEVEGRVNQLLMRLGTELPASPESFALIQQMNELLHVMPGLPEHWLSRHESLGKNNELYKAAVEKFQEFHSAKENVTKRYAEDVYEVDIEDLRSNLQGIESAIQSMFKEPLLYLDQLSEQSSAVREMLMTTNELFAQMDYLDNFSRKLFSLDSEPDTFEYQNKLLFLLEKIGSNLQPTEYWFDRDSIAKVKQLAKDSQSKIEEYKIDLHKFKEKYDLELLNRQEHTGMLDRFMKDYSSIFRVFKKSYRDDRKTFNFYLKNKGKLTFDALLSDVKLVSRIKEKSSWLEAENEHLKKQMGELFQGEETNWDLLLECIHATEELCDFINVNNMPMTLIQEFLLQSSVSDIEQVANLHQKLTTTMNQYSEIIAELQTHIVYDVPCIDNSAVFQEVHEQIKQIIAVTDSFLNIKKEILMKSQDGHFKSYEEFTKDLNLIGEYRFRRLHIEQDMSAFQEAFGTLFTGYNTDWSGILNALEWTKKIKHIFNSELPHALIRLIANHDTETARLIDKEVNEVNDQLHNGLSLLQFYHSIFPQNAVVFQGKTYDQTSYLTIIAKLIGWAEESYKLEEWTALQQILKDSEMLGIMEFINQVKGLNANQKIDLKSLFLKRFYKLWLDYAYEMQPNLQHFNADQHAKLITQFKHLDQSQLNANGARVHGILNTNKKSILNVLGQFGSEVRSLNREVAKKRAHKPIRKLFTEIPELLFGLKPCMMMSPMSVSQFIDPSIVHFDLVIFDEASQLCSEDAVGSIFRGKQIIIAGDKKQLPPTKFFGTSIEEDEEFLDEDDESNDSYESVLEEASVFMPTRPLLWHYRSKHESLIAFSNREIYDDELYTFPSSSNGSNDGVSFVYVQDGVYERSTSRRNLVEAKKVANMVFEHIERSPGRSLGIIAFSEAQQQAIYDQIMALRKQFPQHEEFFDDSRSEYFFVKNLENVQGDERDTIFFSVGYGKDQNGMMHYNFGPLNKPGGERRLNVAVTRAKHEIKLVSSILHSDLDDSKLTKKGPQLLKSYLFYAKTDGEFNQISGGPDGDFDSPLEEDVYEALTSRGLMLRKQVGCSSYRIDLAVVDPNNPGNYLLGIECDGAAYHSSKTARDRDRLRQQVLESLGWRIHRIWSQDWFRRKKDEIDKILNVLSK